MSQLVLFEEYIRVRGGGEGDKTKKKKIEF